MDLTLWNGSRRLNFNLSSGAGPQFPVLTPVETDRLSPQHDKRGTWDVGLGRTCDWLVAGARPLVLLETDGSCIGAGSFLSTPAHVCQQDLTKRAMVPGLRLLFGRDLLAWAPPVPSTTDLARGLGPPATETGSIAGPAIHHHIRPPACLVCFETAGCLWLRGMVSVA